MLASSQLSRGFRTSIPSGSDLYSQRRFLTASGASANVFVAMANPIAAIHTTVLRFHFICFLPLSDLQARSGILLPDGANEEQTAKVILNISAILAKPFQPGEVCLRGMASYSLEIEDKNTELP